MADDLLKVILVDDETLVRDHIRLSINWKQLGLTVAAEASNGLEALDVVDREHPAIAIVDINIPNPDGIQLSERIRAEHPECQVIILSGFNEFDYAKKALRAGVKEYLLKPLRAEELEAALVAARDVYMDSTRQKHYIRNLERRADQSGGREREGRIAALVTGLDPREEPGTIPELEGTDFCIAVPLIDGYEDRWPDIHEQNRWHEGIIEILADQESSPLIPAILGPEGLPVALFSGPENADAGLSELRQEVARRFGFTLSGGISPSRRQSESLRTMYLEALRAVNDRFFSGLNMSYHAPVESRGHRVLLANKTDIILPLRMGDLDSLIRLVEDKVAEIRRERLDYESVDLMVMEVIAAATQFLAELDIDLDPLLEEGGRNWRSVARSRETLDELADWLVHSFEVILDHAKDDVRFKTYKVVDKAMQYIRDHYRDRDLNLRTIAEAVNTNPTYLSKIFKLQSGFSVIEYLREVRLEESKALLTRSPSSQIQEVAEAVGFSDPLYFSKVFKGRYGISPKKFQRS